MIKAGLLGFVVGITTIYINQTLPSWLWVGAGILVVLLLLWSLFLRPSAYLLSCLSLRCVIFVAALLFAHGYADSQLEDAMAARIQQPVTATALVRIQQISDGAGEHWRQVVEVQSSNPAWSGKQRWLIYSSQYDPHGVQSAQQMRPGELWQINVQLKPIHGLASAGSFDQEKWLVQEHITAKGYLQSAQLIANFAPNLDFISQVQVSLQLQRLHIRQHFQRFDSPAAGVLLGLLTGDRSLITPQTTHLYQSMGISHLLAISGPHVLLAAVMFTCLLRWLLNQFPFLYLQAERPRWLIPSFVGLVVLYACLAGFDIPAQRTVLMTGMGSMLAWWRIGFRQLTIWLYAAAVLLIVDPLVMLSPAFVLSFGAVAILIMVFQLPDQVSRDGQILSLWAKSKQLGWQFVRMQWLMFILLIPLVLISFQAVSLLSPVVNLLAIPLLSMLIVPVNLLAWLLFFISPWLADHIWHILLMVLQGFHQALSLIDIAFPMALQPVSMNPLKSVVLLLAIILLVLPKGVLPKWWLAFLVVPFYIPAQLSAPLLVQVLDVGQGLSVLIKTKQHGMLVDTGGKLPNQAQGMGERVVLPTLHAQGINRLDKLMLTHLDNDHSGGAPAVLAKVSVVQLTSSETFASYPTYICQAGQNWWWDGVHFEVLSPSPDMQGNVEANDASCVLKVSTPATALVPAQHVLIMGDAGIYPEYLLLNKQVDVKADVLVLGHHGSRFSSSSAFLQAVEPQRAVVSAGYLNRYHHPAPIVLARLNELGIAVDSTIDSGTLSYELGKSKQIEPERYRERVAWLQQSPQQD